MKWNKRHEAFSAAATVTIADVSYNNEQQSKKEEVKFNGKRLRENENDRGNESVTEGDGEMERWREMETSIECELENSTNSVALWKYLHFSVSR